MGTSVNLEPVGMEIGEVYLVEFIKMGLEFLLFLLG